MKTFQDEWLEKVASMEIPKVKKGVLPDLIPDLPAEKPVADSIPKLAAAPKAAPQASDVTNSPRPTLVVTFNDNDSQCKMFIERLDKVLSSMSGLERLQIKGFHSMKSKNAIDQLKAPAAGIALFKGKTMIGSLGIKSMESDIRKFLESNRKNFV